MKTRIKDGQHAKLVDAFALMERALMMLDEAGAPGQIGAYLDMAMCELQSKIDAAPIAVELFRLGSQGGCAWPLSPAPSGQPIGSGRQVDPPTA